MASRTIEPDHSGTRSLRRVARHYIRKAARDLATARLPEPAVHHARKELKKSRTAVRLLRDALGEPVYRRENRLLRDAAHALNAARDAKVLVETLRTLRRAHRELQQDAALAGLARSLRAEHARLQRQLSVEPAQLAPRRRALEQVRHRAGRWQVGKHGWSILGPAIRRIYKNGRCALPAARPRPPDAALHEWRKQVKDLRYALRMLSPMDPQELCRLARQTERLTDCLGQAHDLAVLAGKAQAFAQREHADLQPLLAVIDREHERLTVDSLVAGERLYRDRPRQFDRRLARRWHQWRRANVRH